MNSFIKNLFQANTTTENGAVSNASTNSALLDYFSKSGTYRDRELTHVFADMGRIWAESPRLALQILFYNRLVTRQKKGFQETERVQMGQGNRSEFRKCLIWLNTYHPNTLAKNMWLIPVAGSWKDLWHEEVITLLNRDAVYNLIKAGLEDSYNRNLIAKYLPRIRSKSNTHNERHVQLNAFAYGLCRFLKWTPKDYRKFKASGTAHSLQQQMCANEWDALKFNSIPGKALNRLVNNRGLDNLTTLQRHGIEDNYLAWIQNQSVAKFTGYVYELMEGVLTGMNAAQKLTIDKQFDGLIELAKKDRAGLTENVWCALDTSGSMQTRVANTSAFNLCISLGIYFSTLNEGAFKDQVVLFDNQSRSMQLKGSFSDKVNQILRANTAWGSTNFQSVIDEIVRVRKANPHIPVSDFPTTLIVVSDMQFNPVGGNTQTNYQAAMRKLREVGLPNIRIVWWWVTGRGQDFPSTLDDEGVVMIGGFDGSIISLLLGVDPPEYTVHERPALSAKATAADAMMKALDQEILQAVQV